MCAQGLQRLIKAPSTGSWAHGRLPVCGTRQSVLKPCPIHSISHTRSIGCNVPGRSQRCKRNLAPRCTNASPRLRAAGGASRLAVSSYSSNKPANLLTCDHREAVANLLNGEPVLASIGERIEKTQVSPIGFIGSQQALIRQFREISANA
jgi:hypothetical protein